MANATARTHAHARPAAPARRTGIVGNFFGWLGRTVRAWPKTTAGIVATILLAFQLGTPLIWTGVALVLAIVFRRELLCWVRQHKTAALASVAAFLLIFYPMWNATWVAIGAVALFYAWATITHWMGTHKMATVGIVLASIIWFAPQGVANQFGKIGPTAGSWANSAATQVLAAKAEVHPLIASGFTQIKSFATGAKPLAAQGLNEAKRLVAQIIAWARQ
ncbi:hypothetical protein A2818_02810 [Candidatus Nomurabacteria bacterium RIFCSPHIGHO2_01_FULL_40_12]|uniref:Uncharacterized protein n=1 Tax=Candidatus Nomurabacteria bacterium RIFCSPHIGHO2_01_FULL_40_12 TaxID=1801737 RepID=A0A1F6V1I5_9BACT|nr:MAG: hypothetical protein A2818_02810 [Candidatus Nomurabacteria bacterium RIFCSPHIGHO2_01_FULL_40_12]